VLGHGRGACLRVFTLCVAVALSIFPPPTLPGSALALQHAPCCRTLLTVQGGRTTLTAPLRPRRTHARHTLQAAIMLKLNSYILKEQEEKAKEEGRGGDAARSLTYDHRVTGRSRVTKTQLTLAAVPARRQRRRPSPRPRRPLKRQRRQRRLRSSRSGLHGDAPPLFLPPSLPPSLLLSLPVCLPPAPPPALPLPSFSRPNSLSLSPSLYGAFRF
jgi:hypothetical protein